MSSMRCVGSVKTGCGCIMIDDAAASVDKSLQKRGVRGKGEL